MAFDFLFKDLTAMPLLMLCDFSVCDTNTAWYDGIRFNTSCIVVKFFGTRRIKMYDYEVITNWQKP